MKLSVGLPEMGKLHPERARTHPGTSWITPDEPWLGLMPEMQRLRTTLIRLIGVFLMSALAWGTGQEGKTPLQPLTATQVLEEVMARATQGDQRDLVKQYRFKVLRVRDKLDGQGGLKERDEEVFENVLIQGLPYQRLLVATLAALHLPSQCCGHILDST